MIDNLTFNRYSRLLVDSVGTLDVGMRAEAAGTLVSVLVVPMLLDPLTPQIMTSSTLIILDLLACREGADLS